MLAFYIHFYLVVFKATLAFLITVSAVLRQTWKKNSVKYLQGINFSQLSVAEMTDFKNLSRAALHVDISVIYKQNTKFM